MFFSMPRVKGYLGKIGITSLVLVMLALSGCSIDGGGTASIYGKWVSTGGDSYIITNTTLTYGSTYAGTIKNIREDGPGNGYIVIQFTEHSVSFRDADTETSINPLGRFFVVHYQNLTSSSVELANAYGFGDPDNIEGEYDWSEWGMGVVWSDAGGEAGKTSQEIAEATYTVENGYYGVHGAYQK